MKRSKTVASKDALTAKLHGGGGGKERDNCGLWLMYQQKQMVDVETTPRHPTFSFDWSLLQQKE